MHQVSPGASRIAPVSLFGHFPDLSNSESAHASTVARSSIGVLTRLRAPLFSARNLANVIPPGRFRLPRFRAISIPVQVSGDESETRPEFLFGHVPCLALYSSARVGMCSNVQLG